MLQLDATPIFLYNYFVDSDVFWMFELQLYHSLTQVKQILEIVFDWIVIM